MRQKTPETKSTIDYHELKVLVEARVVAEAAMFVPVIMVMIFFLLILIVYKITTNGCMEELQQTTE